ncbi:hypothetical protein ES703_56756 [subsurface metagenome]
MKRGDFGLYYEKMKLYRPIKHLERIDYPTLNEVRAYTETYRVEYMDRVEPDKGWHKFNHSPELEVLTIGGMNNYFVVYAYPPAGVEIAKPEDILTYELWRGWILELINYEPTYRLDTATYREGYAAFKRRKTELGY